MKSILAVDDIKTNLKILVELLGDEYDLLVATSAKMALETLKDETVDLILLDIVMPDMDGFSLCQNLQKSDTTKNIPIIFLTSSSDEENIEKAYDLGGSDYIIKPFRPKELQAKIKREFKLQDLQKELESMAFRDPMTRLYNRRYFEQEASRIYATALQRHEVFSLSIIDIDNFKKINDTYGHPIGDRVIIYLANFLIQNQRQDDLVIRFGGEEFVVLFPNTTQRDAYESINRLREEIATSPLILRDNESLYFTVSAGVTQIDLTAQESLSSVIKHADEALYQAKESGRNQVKTYTPSVQSPLL